MSVSYAMYKMWKQFQVAVDKYTPYGKNSLYRKWQPLKPNNFLTLADIPSIKFSKYKLEFWSPTWQ